MTTTERGWSKPTAQWRPVATADLASSAWEAIEGIERSLMPEGHPRFGVRSPSATVTRLTTQLAADSERCEETTLIDGMTGAALFFAELAKVSGRSEHRVAAEQYLDTATEAVGRYPMPPSLFHGFLGPAWCRSLTGVDEGELYDIDQMLTELLTDNPWHGEVDLMRGLAGFGVYAATRSHQASAAALVDAVVATLDRLSEASDGSARWRTGPEMLPSVVRQARPQGQYSFGLAHGHAGILMLISKVTDDLQRAQRVRPLLRGCLRWLEINRTPSELSMYPSVVDIATGETIVARNAWCNGDLGVALAQLSAGSVLQDAEVVRSAIETGLHAAIRPAETCGIVDASLCHGSSGVSHMFNRLFQATGRPEFRHGALYWLEHTLSLRRVGYGVGGFAYADFNPATRTRTYIGLCGFLNGAAGIGLSLLAALGNEEPSWDDVLLTRPTLAAAAPQMSTA